MKIWFLLEHKAKSSVFVWVWLFRLGFNIFIGHGSVLSVSCTPLHKIFTIIYQKVNYYYISDSPVIYKSVSDFVFNLYIYKVELFTATPYNIPAESFEVYGVALAFIAQAFTGKKPRLIKEADSLFQQLQQIKVTALSNSNIRENREADFALERGLCSLLVGEVDECRSWLGLNDENSPYREPSIVTFVMEHSRNDPDNDLLPGLCKLLETWLDEVVFPRFRETADAQFKLGDYYDDPIVLRYLERLEGVGGSPLAAAAAIAKIGAEATAVLDTVKVGAIQALQKVFPLGQEVESVKRYNNNNNGAVEESFAIETDELVSEENKLNGNQEREMITYQIKDLAVKIACAGMVVGLLTLTGLKFVPFRKGPRKEVSSVLASDVISVGMI